MTTRSGQHRINLAAMRELRDEIDAALPPLRAKPLASTRAERTDPHEIKPKDPQHAEFLAAFGAVYPDRMGLRETARCLDISHRYLLDLAHGRRESRTAAHDWVELMWSLLGRQDIELPSRTGTFASW